MAKNEVDVLDVYEIKAMYANICRKNIKGVWLRFCSKTTFPILRFTMLQ